MKLVLIEQPITEIISLEEAKTYLRIDHNFEDELIKMLIKSARATIEALIQKSIMYQTWEYTINKESMLDLAAWNQQARNHSPNFFRGLFSVPLLKSPVVEIVSVKIKRHTLDGETYWAEKINNKHCLVFSCENLPNHKIEYPIVIQHKSGISRTIEEVPYQLKLANLMLVANAYQDRYSYSGNPPISQGVKQLLFPFMNINIF